MCLVGLYVSMLLQNQEVIRLVLPSSCLAKACLLLCVVFADKSHHNRVPLHSMTLCEVYK